MDTTSFTRKSIGLETFEPALTPQTGKLPTFIRKPKIGTSKSKTKKRDIPEGLWTKCPTCETMIFDKELDENLKVCAKCNHHFPIGARERIHSLVETCTFEEMDAEMTSVDMLGFKGVATYASKLEAYKKNTMLKDAVLTGLCYEALLCQDLHHGECGGLILVKEVHQLGTGQAVRDTEGFQHCVQHFAFIFVQFRH